MFYLRSSSHTSVFHNIFWPHYQHKTFKYRETDYDFDDLHNNCGRDLYDLLPISFSKRLEDKNLKYLNRPIKKIHQHCYIYNISSNRLEANLMAIGLLTYWKFDICFIDCDSYLLIMGVLSRDLFYQQIP